MQTGKVNVPCHLIVGRVQVVELDRVLSWYRFLANDHALKIDFDNRGRVDANGVFVLDHFGDPICEIGTLGVQRDYLLCLVECGLKENVGVLSSEATIMWDDLDAANVGQV